jgi:hypothetical protein
LFISAVSRGWWRIQMVGLPRFDLRWCRTEDRAAKWPSGALGGR